MVTMSKKIKDMSSRLRINDKSQRMNTDMCRHSGSVGFMGGIHRLITPIAPLSAASTKSEETL